MMDGWMERWMNEWMDGFVRKEYFHFRLAHFSHFQQSNIIISMTKMIPLDILFTEQKALCSIIIF